MTVNVQKYLHFLIADCFRPTTTAFSNEFFTSAFESWKERLSEGELLEIKMF